MELAQDPGGGTVVDVAIEPIDVEPTMQVPYNYLGTHPSEVPVTPTTADPQEQMNEQLVLASQIHAPDWGEMIVSTSEPSSVSNPRFVNAKRKNKRSSAKSPVSKSDHVNKQVIIADQLSAEVGISVQQDKEPRKNSVVISNIPKVKQKKSANKPANVIGPRWKVVPLAERRAGVLQNIEDQHSNSKEPSRTELKPKVWSSSRQELIAVLPELAGSKLVNGISWGCSETPVILLEEDSSFTTVSRCNENLAIEITMMRDFVCAIGDMYDPNAPSDPSQRSEHRQDPQDIQKVTSAKPPQTTQFPQTMLNPDSSLTLTPKETPTPNKSYFNNNHITSPPCAENLIPVSAGVLGDSPIYTSSPTTLIPPLTNPIYHDNYRDFLQYDIGSRRGNFIPWGTQVYPPFSSSFSTLPQASYPENHLEDYCTCSRFSFVRNCQKCNGETEASTTTQQTRPYSQNFLPNSYHSPFAHGLHTSIHDLPHANPKAQNLMPHQSVYPWRYPENIQWLRSQETPMWGHSEPQIEAEPRIPQVSPMDCDEKEGITESRPTVTIMEDKHIREVPESQDTCPSLIPQEIQVLVDAYLLNTPINVIVSRSYFILVNGTETIPDEYAYMHLGRFCVSRVWEQRLNLEQILGKTLPQKRVSENISGRMKWRFRLEWVADGDDLTHSPDMRVGTWWDTNPGDNSSHSGMDISVESLETDTESTHRYRLQKIAHKIPGRVPVYLLPLECFAPFGPEVSDGAFPRGWHCDGCGKLNFQDLMRHRGCSSSFCKGKPTPKGFSHNLDAIRDPQDALPMSVPCNRYNNVVDAKVAIWDDGMRTHSYFIDSGRRVVLKHIFTCNLEDLQQTPSMLLQQIQINIPLRRRPGENNPYFEWTIENLNGKQACNIATPWKDALECIEAAKEFILSRASDYGEVDRHLLPINHFRILGWVSLGNKRASDILCANQHSILMLCLGCEVVLTIFSKSMRSVPAIGSSEQNPSGSAESVDVPTVAEYDAQIVKGRNVRVSKQKKDKAPKEAKECWEKMSSDAVVITLVHGDILVLTGDEFEYSVKRTGTSVLLIGSHIGRKENLHSG